MGADVPIVDDYVVRLGRAPVSPSVGEPTFGPARPSRKVPVRLIVVAVLVLLAAFNRSTVEGWVREALDTAKAPVRALEADGELRKAEEALVRQWSREGTYDVPIADLERLDPSIHWSDVVRYQSCLGGIAAVISADAATGTQSQLMLRGGDQGVVMGDVGCPKSASNLEPWGDLPR